MIGRDAYSLLVQLLNPEFWYISNDNSLLALDSLSDIYGMAVCNIKLSEERQVSNNTCAWISCWTLVLVRNYTRDVWDPKYNLVYHVGWVMGRQMDLINESGKIQKVNIQDVRIMYKVDELITCLPDDKSDIKNI